MKLIYFKVSLVYNSAFFCFKNKGRFVVDTPEGKALLNYSWLESAYMVRDGDDLKIKFYFSDAVEQTSEPIE